MAITPDLLSSWQLEKRDVEKLLESAQEMERALSIGKVAKPNGKIVATMFFEPSTRTQSSFAAASMRLGCQVLRFNVSNSSLAKGESFEDTVRMFDSYADLLVLRHPTAGFAKLAADLASHPVVNAGDGGNEHPSQCLIDLYTILKLKKKAKGLNVTLCGDLKHARAMRSLFCLLGMFGSNITLCAPKGLEMDAQIVDKVREKFNPSISFANSPSLSDCDVLYVCRVQKERFSDASKALAEQRAFRMTSQLLKSAKSGMAILHPLPRLEEMPSEVDATSHAQYFLQAKLAVPVRMAIIKELLGISYP